MSMLITLEGNLKTLLDDAAPEADRIALATSRPSDEKYDEAR